MDNNKEKTNILNAWILEEYLSEGNIDLKDGDFTDLRQDSDFYTIFKDKLNKIKSKKDEKKGAVVYAGIKSAKEVMQTMWDLFHVEPDEENKISGNKFQVALYFDENLNLHDMFITAYKYFTSIKLDSSQRKKMEIPKIENFYNFEKNYQNKLMNEWDEYLAKVSNSHNESIIKEQFAKFMSNLISEYQSGEVKVKGVENIETEVTTLHSFFIEDLEQAKNISNRNLDDYLFGTDNHQNLNPNENKDIFYEILQPGNYPLGRFPSNKEYALSLMQQVAVNLAIGYDNRQIRSVNGPPGTGKTTLLKDIFAELIVKQAYEIVNFKTELKSILYNNNGGTYKILKMPECIADKGIVVASSNHAAIQNIVNELPLKSKIEDSNLLIKITEADYFTDISNHERSNHEQKWTNDGKINDKPISGMPRYGLFSLEGGKKKNMDDILYYLDKVWLYLKNDYINQRDVYTKFKDKYAEVNEYKNKTANYIENIYKYRKIWETLKEAEEALEKYTEKYETIKQKIDNLSLQKRWYYIFPWVKDGKAYYEKKKQYSKQQIELLNKKEGYQEEIIECKKQKAQILENIRNDIEWIKSKQNKKMDIDYNLDPSDLYNEINKKIGIKSLDMNEDYKSLQKDNPWFSVCYRELQSELFIEALRVRKQFLYENINNIKSAQIIWKYQNRISISNTDAIKEAWNWINFTIPVIGTTFASLKRMFEHIGENGIGYLFVDEAGQAVPQACVGGIVRSRNVMVVGDPAQIRPVVTLDEGILSLIRKRYGVSEKYLSENASVQTLVDQASMYGYYKDREKPNWIGIPLWVHRRCKSPMFDISNAISYDGKMVQGASTNPGKAFWYDVSGVANDKYVDEQGEKLKDLLLEIQDKDPEAFKKDNYIYVITPFRNVAEKLAEKLKSIGFTKYENKKPKNVGTVHTFQGKEAKIVFLVLGADKSRIGAAEWAMGPENPNIMNVAATRAKEEFYIIGDKKLYGDLHSFVIDKTLKILARNK